MKVSVVGAGGHCRSILPIILNSNYEVFGVFDDNFSENEEVYPNIFLKGKLKDIEGKVCLAIGNNDLRKKLFNDLDCIEKSLIHSAAYVENSSVLGKANFIHANVFINSLSKIGNNNIINSGAIIEHETIIGSHNHISVGAKLCGRVQVGDNCFVGAGATIVDGVSICNNVTIGAGAVVVKDISKPGTYVGVPVREVP